jgi:hypothetical protein
MHEKPNNWIIMIKVGFSKRNITFFDNRVKISMFIEFEISVKIKFKIFEDKLNSAYIWNKPKIDVLKCINFPMLQGRDLNRN